MSLVRKDLPIGRGEKLKKLFDLFKELSKEENADMMLKVEPETASLGLCRHAIEKWNLKHRTKKLGHKQKGKTSYIYVL